MIYECTSVASVLLLDSFDFCSTAGMFTSKRKNWNNLKIHSYLYIMYCILFSTFRTNLQSHLVNQMKKKVSFVIKIKSPLRFVIFCCLLLHLNVQRYPPHLQTSMYDYLVFCSGQNDKNAQAKQKKKKMTDEEILSRLSKNALRKPVLFFFTILSYFTFIMQDVL